MTMDSTQLTRRGALQATAGLATIGMFASSVSAETIGGDGSFTSAPSDPATVHSNMAGSGTSSDPYQVTDPHELQSMSQDLTAHYQLQNNLDMSGTSNWNSGSGFSPVGTWDGGAFTGTFDGDGYRIKNLYVSRSSTNRQALFGYLDGASISNVAIIDPDITGASQCGGIAGRGDNGVRIEQAMVDGGQLTSTGYCGGILGTASAGSPVVINCVARTQVEGVNSPNAVGGAVGQVVSGVTATFEATYAATGITTSGDSGGFIGVSGDGAETTRYCYWDTEVSGLTSSAGTATGLTTSEMTGDSAETNMSDLDWSAVWTTTAGDYPDLQQFYIAPTYAADITVEDGSGAALEGATVAVEDTSLDVLGSASGAIGPAASTGNEPSMSLVSGDVVSEVYMSGVSFTGTTQVGETAETVMDVQLARDLSPSTIGVSDWETVASLGTVDTAAESEYTFSVSDAELSTDGTYVILPEGYDGEDGIEIGTVEVRGTAVDSGGSEALTKTTGADGVASFTLEDGEYAATATLDGYEDASGSLSVSGAAVSTTLTMAAVVAEEPTDTTDSTDDSTTDDTTNTSDTEESMWDRLFGSSSSDSDDGGFWDDLFGSSSSDSEEDGFWSRLFGRSSSSDNSEESFLDSLFNSLGLR